MTCPTCSGSQSVLVESTPAVQTFAACECVEVKCKNCGWFDGTHSPDCTPGEPSAEVKRWPFVESPGEFADRLTAALNAFDGYVLGAVRNVLIENPPQLDANAALRQRDERIAELVALIDDLTVYVPRECEECNSTGIIDGRRFKWPQPDLPCVECAPHREVLARARAALATTQGER